MGKRQKKQKKSGVSSDLIEKGGSGGDRILKLPEECVWHIIALTSPRDACRLEAVSVAFRAAAVSDVVWERILPLDIVEILSRAISRIEFSSMKHLYFQLCEPILIDGGKKSFWLDREKGSKCYMLAARELFIARGQDLENWAWNAHPKSRFAEVAQLLRLRCLEIHGKIDASILSPRTHYAAYLVYDFTDSPTGLSYAYQDVSVTLGSNISKSTTILYPGREELDWMRCSPAFQEHRREPAEEDEEADGFPFIRRDEWIEVLLGEFYNEDGKDGEIDMCSKDVDGRGWKRGLIIQGIEVRPSK